MEVLEPGKVITPGNDLQGQNCGENSSGARPKSGNQTKKGQNDQTNRGDRPRSGKGPEAKGQNATDTCRPRSGKGPKANGKNATERPNSGKGQERRGQNGIERPRSEKGPGGKGQPNRRQDPLVYEGIQQRNPEASRKADPKRKMKADGEDNGQKNTPRGGKNNGKQDCNPRGRNNNTPRNQQNRNKQQKMCFDPYLSQEELQRGLKLGQIIQGPIRINPKNYEEGYIPHPDGVSDIFISGMKDRNRALNGDIVAVMLYDREDWKIHVENLKSLEEKHSETDTSKSESVTVSLSEVKEDQNSTDSEPDVIIESEEIIHLTKTGEIEVNNQSESSTISTSQNTNQSESSIVSSASNVEKSCDNTLSASNTEESGKQGATSSKSVEAVTDKLSEVTMRESKSKSAGQATPKADGRGTDKNRVKGSDRKHRNTPGSAQKKYSTLQEVMKEGSEVVRNLFKNGDGENNPADKHLQRTGKVVAIIEPKHSRACTGHVHLMNDKNPNTALFKPLDYRLPRIMVPMENCPKDFLQRSEDHVNTLFICRIIAWRENSNYADGELMRSLGEAGEIEPQTESILIETDVDYSEFTEEILSSLPVHELPWTIPEEEITKRRDFRKDCIFTIDPATARDLDDALSCEQLEDGTYNVGVHIADVTYFLREDTDLDKKAGFRATSVYLVQKVIPMLPRILCEELCSLNPDQDRLTFSVVWNMSETGEIYGEWFGRSVIRSCVKLSYDHAQGFIEEPDREWTEEELPPISEGYSIKQIRDIVVNLQKIAKNLRKARFDEGALRLDQVKLQYTLDKETGMPNGYMVYKQRDSNRLVEEFMLLANMAVAHKIKKHYPDKAFLRRHPPPQVKMVDDLVELCNNLGFPIDASSAGTLQRSLWRYAGTDELSTARMQVLVSMCSKPMQNAKYFCTGCIDDESLYRHYALNVPLYTHFTSPIRRYADVMVHRMLAAALDYEPLTDKSKQVIQGIADNCNDRKTNSKRASELSSELYFAVFVKAAGPFEEEGMVMGVMDKSFDVFILKFGVIKRVYCDKLQIKDKLYYKEQKNPVLTLTWEPAEGKTEGPVQKISIFTIVTCILQPGELPLQWMAIIKPPKG